MIRNNFQVEAGRTAKFTLHPALSILLFLFLFIFSQLASAPFSFIAAGLTRNLPDTLQAPLYFSLAYLVIPLAISMGCFMLFTRFVEKRPVSSLGFSKDRALYKYAKGFLIGVLMMLVYWLLALATGTLSFSQMTFQFDHFDIWISLILVLPGWMIQGASEEVLTRGWLYQSVSAKYGGILGLIVAPGIFGILHLMNSHINGLSMLNLILFGVFAVFYMLYDGSLWGICALHSSWNWAQGHVFGIEISGNTTVGGSLIKPGTFNGPDYMTGAGFGAEGSVIVTLVLLASIAIAIRLYQRKHHQA